MEKIMKILKELRPDVDFAAEKELIDGGVLNSFNIMTLVEELSDAYDIDIDTDDIGPHDIMPAVQTYQPDFVNLRMMLKSFQCINQNRLVIYVDKLLGYILP